MTNPELCFVRLRITLRRPLEKQPAEKKLINKSFLRARAGNAVPLVVAAATRSPAYAHLNFSLEILPQTTKIRSQERGIFP